MNPPYGLQSQYKAIWACDNQGGIGVEGRLPWRLREDLRAFKAYTLAKPVIMGRLTQESLPLQYLPGRTNYVLSSSIGTNPHVKFARTPMDIEHDLNGNTAIVIGGSTVYDLYLNNLKEASTTIIDAYFDCDTDAPLIPRTWKIRSKTTHHDNDLGVTYYRVIWDCLPTRGYSFTYSELLADFKSGT